MNERKKLLEEARELSKKLTLKTKEAGISYKELRRCTLRIYNDLKRERLAAEKEEHKSSLIPATPILKGQDLVDLVNDLKKPDLGGADRREALDTLRKIKKKCPNKEIIMDDIIKLSVEDREWILKELLKQLRPHGVIETNGNYIEDWDDVIVDEEYTKKV